MKSLRMHCPAFNENGTAFMHNDSEFWLFAYNVCGSWFQLKAGFYMFHVAVSSMGKYGEAFVNVTVLLRKFCQLHALTIFICHTTTLSIHLCTVSFLERLCYEIRFLPFRLCPFIITILRSGLGMNSQP